MVDFGLPGIKKQSFSDYLSNTNTLAEQDYSTEPEASPFTLNNRRVENAFKVDPAKEHTLTDQKEPSLMPVLNQDGLPAAGPKPPEEQTGIMGKIKGFFGKENWKSDPSAPLIGNLKGDEFMALAGALSQAIAPDTAQGRAGGAISKFAQPLVKSRRAAEAEAPEKALAKRLTEAKIRDLDRTKDPKTAMEWYLAQNPEASESDVIAFKKGTEKGTVSKVTSDDGTVRFINQKGEEVGKTKAGAGKTKSEPLYKTTEGFKTAEEAKGAQPYSAKKEPSPVTWTTATKGLSGRFGKQDATGNIIITPELQQSHRVAQKKLVELQQSEKIKPLDAINKAEDYARQVESDFWSYSDDVGNIPKADREKYLDNLKKSYKSRFGYIPKIRPRS